MCISALEKTEEVKNTELLEWKGCNITLPHHPLGLVWWAKSKQSASRKVHARADQRIAARPLPPPELCERFHPPAHLTLLRRHTHEGTLGSRTLCLRREKGRFKKTLSIRTTTAAIKKTGKLMFGRFWAERAWLLLEGWAEWREGETVIKPS